MQGLQSVEELRRRRRRLRQPGGNTSLFTTLTATQINAGASASGLQAIAGPAKCDVQVVALNYTTVGVNAEKTNASGVMLLPSRGQDAFSKDGKA